MLTPDANVPGLHGVSTVLPVGAKWPAVVSMHSLRLRRAGTLWAVRARLAGDARLLALFGLVRAGCAPVARALACDGLDGAGAALGLLGATRWRKASLVGWRALTGAREVGGDRVRTLRARQRRAGALGAERAGLAGSARLLAPFGLVRACCALVAGALLRDGLDVARAALGLLGAARRRGVARGGLVALRRAGASWAVRARLAGNAPILALVSLVRTGCALVARALACVGLDGARATLGLLRAARRCIVARISRRALLGAAEVGPIRVRAFAAWQWRRRALRAVRSRHAHVALGPTGLVHKLACAALVACWPLGVKLHGTRAARRRIGAARGCVRAWQGWRALAIGAEVGLVGVRARRARQHDAGPLGAVRAGLASSTCLLAFAALVLTGRATVARALACVGLNGAGAAPGRFDAASRRVGSCRYISATGRTTQAGEIAPRATGARYTPHAPRLAVAALLACGRSDSGRCSAHVASRTEGGAQTAGLL
eukprot:scaffold47157_cov68-Phaeocystis_antarctica.AAC.1